MTFELRAYRDDHIGHIHAEDVSLGMDTLEQASRIADRFGLGFFTFESGTVTGQVFNFSDGMISVNPK